MPDPLDLSTEAALCHASARAQAIRAELRAGQTPPIADLLWLAGVAAAALLLAAPTDLDMAAWLAASDDLSTMPRPPWPAHAADTREIPAWLLRLAPDPQQES